MDCKTIHLVNVIFIVDVPSRTFAQSEGRYVTIAFPQNLENNILSNKKKKKERERENNILQVFPSYIHISYRTIILFI